ncbi:glucose 1-dehydrogenase [Limosilactobacillus fastidiosus]|uniref:Glucose 1-dehydrogenase n=1 Tax=Limosilactobacillus fastidiosus TaxID=2759855 RepID=A0A7W3YCH1_9LACO|nr:glucose 1-dehydrogenase [Limosilactobacillus fastidiosus]MBB1086205.1 glucose 1-dehydrogenase [Limosilactobacillus fastidiosus]MCD7086524.1 glucose 1-dehydrogenase [Limosilactobacillus fastidiosus]MCD7114965.1 glucose 1-dehydrogenase [Limosilactobacillus fastidiosus]MCD7116640.1 glucose 1-dehydrogenase [Limosilactobacillus fastidiosus]
MNRLKDKVAIITGGSMGIGFASAKLFIKEGAKVVITARNSETGEKAAKELGPNAIFVQQDVSQERDWQRVIDTTLKTFDKLNVVVNNAGVGIFADAENITNDIWNKTIAINLTGTMYGIHYGINAMKDNHESNSIINVSSIEGLIGDPDLFAYNASKGGVRMMTKSAALDTARKGYDIRINSVHPGYIMTPLVEKQMADDPKLKDKLLGLHPVGRLGKAEEIANMLLFLASDESSFSTGSEFVADGGYTAQ